jgi:peptidoglycan/xylan/chitin deacetylase (PgdA/CDA1 family)
MAISGLALLRSAKEVLSFGMRRGGLTFVARHSYGHHRVGILMYHEPAPDLLDCHLAYLKRHYTFVTLHDVVEALHSGHWSALPTPSVVVTVDDGKRSNYELLPLFQRHEVVPTLYVCSQLIGTGRHFWFDVHPEFEALKKVPHEQRVKHLEELGMFTLTTEYPEALRSALSLAEIAEMGESVDIQSHSRFHPVLTTCSDHHCLDEIARSRGEIEELTGRSCRHFCFPNGDYTDRELQMVRAAGYRSARTIRTGWTGPRSDPYQLNILGVDDHASVNQLAADLAGLGFVEGFVRRARIGNLSGRYEPITLSKPGD